MKIITDISKATDFKTDTLLIGLFRSREGAGGSPQPPESSKGFASHYKDAVQTKAFTAKLGETLFLRNADAGEAKHLLFVGLGAGKKNLKSRLHDAAFAAGNRLNAEKVKSVGAYIPSFENTGDVTDAAQNISLGLLQSVYSFDKYKSDSNKPTLNSVALISSRQAELKRIKTGVSQGEKISAAVSLAKDLCNMPPNDLNPEKLAEWGKRATAKFGVKATIFDDNRLEKEGFGGILAVGRGSESESRLLKLEYKGPHATAAKKVCLVGKGVTFDTGGISLKPAKSMEDMKYDMAGAAMMIASTLAAAALKLPIHLITLIPSAENMPGGFATRPGDVITMYNGKTVEITNTDAEGRLILVDAISYAHKLNPNVIVNSATLTGGVIIALGFEAAGLFSNNNGLLKQLQHASDESGEKAWNLPLFESYQEDLLSGIADYRNSGNRDASSSKAATFLHFFVEEKQPWAHIDIAGVAWHSASKPSGNCATGYGVRMMVEFLKNFNPV